MRTSFDKKDPFTEEIPTTTTSKAEELKKENKDLRKKTAYLEDKITYLQILYEIICPHLPSITAGISQFMPNTVFSISSKILLAIKLIPFIFN